MVLSSRVLAAVVLVLVGACGCSPDAALGPVSPVALSGASPVDILRSWESDRSRAWAAGDADALRALYLPGSALGAQDVRLMRRYAARGLRVTGITMQVLAARVLVRRPDQVRIEVVERFAGGIVTHAGAQRRLPVGQASRRLVELRRRGGAWVLASVGAAESAERGP